MHFTLQTPSLQHLAEVKIVTGLWNRRHILAQIARETTRIGSEDTKIKEIEDDVKRLISALSIPELCKKPLSNIIKPLQREILEWCHFHHPERSQLLESNILLPNQFIWTMHGTIDYAKTAESMVKDKRLGIEKRYEIACVNCLEDRARELIRFIPERRRRSYVHKAGTMRIDYHFLVAYFTCALSDNGVHVLSSHFALISRLRSEAITRHLFKFMLTTGNRAACEYFFKKQNPEDKENALVHCKILIGDCSRSPTCNLLYYLSLMNEEQQRHMFRECIYTLLTCLLHWPMQSLFVETAKCGWQLMGKYDCIKVMNDITRKIQQGFQDFDYCHLFWQCWELNLADYRQLFVRDCVYLSCLIRTKDIKFVQLILNEAPIRRMKWLFNDLKQVLLEGSVVSDAALMECRETAALNSSNEPEDEEKRLRSQYVSLLVDFVVQDRKTRRLF